MFRSFLYVVVTAVVAGFDTSSGETLIDEVSVSINGHRTHAPSGEVCAKVVKEIARRNNLNLSRLDDWYFEKSGSLLLFVTGRGNIRELKFDLWLSDVEFSPGDAVSVESINYYSSQIARRREELYHEIRDIRRLNLSILNQVVSMEQTLQEWKAPSETGSQILSKDEILENELRQMLGQLDREDLDSALRKTRLQLKGQLEGVMKLKDALDGIGEQGGAGEPATRSESDSEGGDKPQPESEGRSR